MSDTQNESDPLATALEALQSGISRLLSSEDFDDLTWLPKDFPKNLMTIAWKHRAEIDGSRFRRELKAYIRSLAEDESA